MQVCANSGWNSFVIAWCRCVPYAHPPSYPSIFSISTPMARSVSCMRTTGSSASRVALAAWSYGSTARVDRAPTPDRWVPARTPPRARVVVSKRRDRVAAEPEPHLLPTLVQVTEQAVRRHADIVEEHQVLTAVGQVQQRPQLDTRRVHRREEVADALVALRVVGVGARGDDEPVAVVAGGAERLLAVDHPLVAVEHRTGAQRREIGTRVRLGVSLGPHDLAGRHAGEERRLLLVGTEAEDRRPHLHADAGEATGAPTIELLLHDARLARGDISAPPYSRGQVGSSQRFAPCFFQNCR